MPRLYMRAGLFCVCAVVLLVVTAILYGTRSEAYSLPPGLKEVLPAGHCLCEYSTNFFCDTCLDCAASQTLLADNNNTHDQSESSDENWVFSFRRDARDYSLDADQCMQAFPGLFEDIDRARRYRKEHGKVTELDLSSIELTKGMVHALVYGGELYILRTHFVDNINREKAVASLAALHRAVVSAPRRSELPNIEFVLSVEDLPAQRDRPIWSLARRAQDEAWWLVPDFGFWSWDMPQLGTFDEVAEEVIAQDALSPFDHKTPELVWRGKITYAPKLRHALVDAAAGKPWGNVGQIKWSHQNDAEFKERFLSPVDQCGYMFIAHAEGRSYSGALKYRQLCRSVIISHKLQWIQHYHYLLKPNGTNQNYVEVERDFSDLDAAMQDLFAHPEKAKRIADNSVQVFRERYLTQAAEACYWRALIKAWKDVSFEPLLYSGVEVGEKYKRTQKRGVRFETFVVYQTARQMDFPMTAEFNTASNIIPADK